MFSIFDKKPKKDFGTVVESSNKEIDVCCRKCKVFINRISDNEITKTSTYFHLMQNCTRCDDLTCYAKNLAETRDTKDILKIIDYCDLLLKSKNIEEYIVCRDKVLDKIRVLRENTELERKRAEDKKNKKLIVEAKKILEKW